jgi:uncharacterized membrane protein YcjF (UPF0283 family)
MAAEAQTVTVTVECKAVIVTVECKAVIVGCEVRVLVKKPGRQRYAKQPLAIIHCNDLEQARRVAERVNGDE